MPVSRARISRFGLLHESLVCASLPICYGFGKASNHLADSVDGYEQVIYSKYLCSNAWEWTRKRGALGDKSGFGHQHTRNNSEKDLYKKAWNAPVSRSLIKLALFEAA
jgi:hypothetical protein